MLSALEELEIDAGRDNANVYMSLVVSLPAELTPPERWALLGNISSFLDEYDLSYVGILHKPDRDGDQRNVHAHIIFSWRSSRWRTVVAPSRPTREAPKYP